jgi:superfamily II DNA or RNA helicase
MKSSPKRRATEKIPVQEIVLLPAQQIHAEALDNQLSKYPFVLDLSMLGAGKTYTSSSYALRHDFLHVVVICPVSVIPKWNYMKKTYGLPIKSIMGYQSLRSTKCRQPKHGLLHRRDYVDQMQTPHPWRVNEFITHEIDKVEFTTTEHYKTMVDEGLLLIIDEIQNIKNISSQFSAAEKLIHEITLRPGAGIIASKASKASEASNASNPDASEADASYASNANDKLRSRVILLSGSPIDKREQATHLFRAIGIMRNDKLAQINFQTYVNEWRGMREIYDFCFLLDSRATLLVRQKGPHELFDEYVYRLFQFVFKSYCAIAMPAPPNAFRVIKQNAYYDIDEEGLEIVRRGHGTLKTVTNFEGGAVTFEAGQGGALRQMHGITRALQIIETGKISLFVRIARDALLDNQKKVVIAVNYTETIKDLEKKLSEFNPLCLSGSTPVLTRASVLEAFQAPNNSRRLLLCNQAVASTGIDLDDKDGNFPRLCLVSPNYSTITSYQLGHRFLRLDTKSNATVQFVYAKQKGKTREQSKDSIELGVLNALSKKSQVMKETCLGQTEQVFPGDHESWEEVTLK